MIEKVKFIFPTTALEAYIELFMLKKERAALIQDYLAKRFPDPPIPLHHTNSYTLLVAVLLSAQCTDVRVNKTTPELFQRADTAEKMTRLSVDEINAIVRPCGLAPRKAQAIAALSRDLVDQFGGEVPQDRESLEGLAGVGRKTASVVRVQAFGLPEFPVDTHIHRLAQVWGLSDGRSVKQTELDLKQLFPRDAWADLHLQIIYYGREVCPARGCDGLRCELCQELFPRRKTPLKPRRA